MFTSTTSGAAHVKSARLRAIAVTAAERVRVYPDLPTLAETVAPGYELGNIYCIFAPAGTPKAILDRIARDVARIVNTGEVRDKLAADGAQPAPPVSVERFKEAYLREVSKWDRFVRKAKGGA
jgi:tripartite-type tricarboxylate transporter receptor subunit TctC